MFSNPLIYFVVIPAVMLLGVYLSRNMAQIRAVAVTGSLLLTALSVWLLVDYLGLRAAGATDPMLYCGDWTWFETINAKLSIGVDGISLAMLLLSSIILLTGSFCLHGRSIRFPRNSFPWLILLSVGVFGFFITIDLFTMFMFYEVALIPMYLLIGIWGTGRKEYSAMKLTLMLMGGSAFLMLSIIGIYYHSGPDANGAAHTFNLLQIAANDAIPHSWQYFLFFPWHLWDSESLAQCSLPHMESRRSRLRSYGCVNAACRRADEARRLRMLPCGDLSDAFRCQ